MDSSLSDSVREEVELARARYEAELAETSKRIAEHEGDTINGKSGVEVLQGILAQRGWDERSGQLQMTRYIDEASDSEDRIASIGIVAPVGTGKTLGYIASALARGERVVIATSTKALQDQIIDKELPQLREDMLNAFGKHITFSVLKGKGNYPCLSHVEATISKFESQYAQASGANIISEVEIEGDEDLATLIEIRRRARIAHAGRDIANYDADTLLSRLAPDTQKAVSAKHSCPSRKIDPDRELEEIARDDRDVWRAAYCEAMLSDIVVMNTALLVQEVIKQNQKMNPTAPNVLEGVGTVVIDEAHHAPNIVTDAFSAKMVRKEVEQLARDVDKRIEGGSGPFAMLTNKFISGLWDADEITKKSDFHEAVATLCDQYAAACLREIEQLSDSGGKKSSKMMTVIDDFKEGALAPAKEIAAMARRKTTRGEGDEARDVFSAKIGLEFDEDRPDMMTISAVPVDVSFFRDRLVSAIAATGPLSRPSVRADKVIVLCSGTMNSSVPRLLGLGGGSVMRNVETPFDPGRVRMCIPSDLPEPREAAAWETEAWSRAARAIKAVDGRTLFLCTSNRMVTAFHERAKADLSYTVLKQGEMSRGDLLRRFAEDEHSVLIATMGFWEGVDVPGPALSLVVIDKTPFPVPSDAIAEARREWVKAEGGQPFMVVDVAAAAMMLAQGAGRLVRSEADAGGVLILDPRLASKRYASAALAQIEGRWMLYKSFDPFVKWMETVAEAHRTGDDSILSRHPADGATPIRPMRPQRGFG